MARSRFAAYLLCLISVLPCCLWGTTQAFFTSRESVEDEMVHLIERSHTSIDMALFELRSSRLANAVQNARGRGVKVRVVLDSSHKEDDLPAGEIRWLGGKTSGIHGLMHHKFALFDQAQVVTGSYNWTPSAEHANYENALLTDDGQTVKSYAREFDELWQRALQGPPPTGTAHPFGQPGYRPTHRTSSRRSSLKTIKIKISTPVIKHRKKTHTIRP